MTDQQKEQEIEQIGAGFTRSLRKYLEHRLRHPDVDDADAPQDGSVAKQHAMLAEQNEQRFALYLKALGFDEASDDFKSLKKHMEQMKTTRGVDKEPKR